MGAMTRISVVYDDLVAQWAVADNRTGGQTNTDRHGHGAEASAGQSRYIWPARADSARPVGDSPGETEP